MAVEIEREKPWPTLAVVIDYTNWRGERSTRTILPLALMFTSNEWHPEPQWLLEAIDIKEGGRPTGEKRTFAMAQIHSWRVRSK